MADDRPQYQHGTGTIGGTQFHWGSGTPGKYWSVPYGDYPVTPDAPTGAWAQSVGAIPIANNVIPDPKLGRDRLGIMIHSGSANSLDELYTQGCFKVAPDEWPTVRKQILDEAHKGPLYLHVQPGGVASFTNTKTMEQASIPTASSPAPPAGTTTLTSTDSSTLDQMRENIGKYESGNDYSILGKRTNSGDQAVGRYQVMKSNIPSWTKKWLGREMTPDEFRADPKAQDAVFNGEFGSYLQAYSPADASSKWFTGGPLSEGAKKSDILGTTGAKYVTSTIGGVDNPYAFNGSTAAASPAAVTATPAAQAAPTFGEAAAKGDVGGAVKALWTRPPPKTDAQGNQVEQKSTLENVADAFGSKGGGQQQGPAPIPEMAPAPVVTDPMMGMAPAAQQLFQQVSQATAQPLSWTSEPYGSNAGLQRIRQGGGTTLNNTGYGYG